MAGDAITKDTEADVVRERTWSFFTNVLSTAHEMHAEFLRHPPEKDSEEHERFGRCARLIDHLATQLYFASGAYAEQQDQDRGRLPENQIQRFWDESAALFRMLANERHPQTIYAVIQTLRHLLPCAPEDIFLICAKAILGSTKFGIQFEHLAAKEVVALVQKALADHPAIFREQAGEASKCLQALLEVLDCFTGWPEARQLTYRLEEI